MSQPIFYEGQQVGCLIHGEGKLNQIKDGYIYVDYGDIIRTYCSDGSYYNHSRPTLYPIDQYREIIANLPAPQPEAWKPKPGEWCWFWDQGDSCVSFVSIFKSYDADRIHPYMTAVNIRYQYCAPFTGELPLHLKEVQP